MLQDGIKKVLGVKMLEYIEINNESASAKIALQGAHLFEYKPYKKKNLLWVSEVSDFEIGKAIRGGVPICWPSFGMNNLSLPQHGFARTSMFEHVETIEIDKNTTLTKLRLNYSQETLKLWAYKFELEVKITVSDSLTIELTTTNLDDKSFKITQALHSYFNISDISHVAITGLDKKPYLDALSDEKLLQSGDITFDKEIDRVYQEVKDEILLQDRDRIITIENEGSSSVVVWNPWIEKCSKMSAMKKDAYKEFVCIESANAYDDFKVIQPRQKHKLKMSI